MDDRTQNVNGADEATKLIVVQLEPALKGLAKLLAAIKFYPTGHPTLREVTRDAQQGFASILQGRESVALGVRRAGFFYEEEPVGIANPLLQKLAGGLFARRVQRLTILSNLSCRDLWEAAQVFLLDVGTLQKQGGVQDLLQQRKVSTIWVNIVDIKGIFERKQQLEKEKAALFGGRNEDETFSAAFGGTQGSEETTVVVGEKSVAAATTVTAEDLSFEALLQAIAQAENDQEFVDLLPRLITVLGANLNKQSAHLVLQALALLVQSVEGAHASPEKRQAARQALTQLATNDVLTYYVGLLCAQVRFDERRVTWERITKAFGEPLSRLLMARLIVEEDQSIRKILFESLTVQGKLALPVILPSLQDPRWYVVRNAAYMLGEIRDPSTVDALKPLLRHDDLRVRREAIRALTRVGGSSVLAILLRTLEEDDEELRRQAMLCLGAMKNPSTVPMLVQFVQAKDWRLQQLEAKVDALRALGEIGSSEALPALFAVATRHRFFFRSRNDELRAAAIAAMGEIGGAETIDILEHMVKASSPVVAKAAQLALKQARKGQKA